MSKIFTNALVIITLAIVSHASAYAQCAPLNVSGASAAAALCPSSGSITVFATGTGLTYQIMSGPTGYPPASNTTGIFNGLAAGSYTIQVRDACGSNSNISRTVTNAYPTFSVLSTSASNVCTSGAQGGTVNGSISGGRSPFQYDIVPVSSSPTYGANTTATTYNENVSSFGTYRFYVKDACGEVRTWDVDVQPSQPLPVTFWWDELLRDRPCGEIIDGLPTFTLNVHLLDTDGIAIDFNNLIGATWQVYKPNPANSITNSDAGCSTPLGALLSSGTINAGGIAPGDAFSYPIAIPQQDIIFQITTLCGQTFKYCYNFNHGNPVTPDANMQVIQESCNAVWNNQVVYVANIWTSMLTAPISYRLTKNGGAQETNTDGYFWGLIPADFPATVLLTDACGRTVTKNLTMPVQGSALTGLAEPQWQFTCTNVRNTATAYIKVTGGDLQGLADATNITITGGTVTAVPRVSSFQNWIPGYYASNLLAGHSYKIFITNLCGATDSLLFSVPNDFWDQPVLNWNLTATVNTLCGQNKGTITATSGFTGNTTVTYYLYNMVSPNTVVATNTTGDFTNVNAGDYKIKFTTETNYSSLCADALITDSIYVTVLSDGAGQTITRKVITNCESGGTALPTGKGTVEVNGSAPFTYEIIKTSLIGSGATEVWNLSSVNNPSNVYTWDLPLVGDPSTTIYTFRSTDKCGNKVTTQGAMQPLSTPNLQTSSNPCVGQMNYTLSINPYPGNFTYRWVKLPDLATTLSTTNSLTFPGGYTAVNDGSYRCYVSLPSCVDRTRDITISSGACGATLPVSLMSFTGSLLNNTATLQWTVENEINLASYDLEKSINGIDYQGVCNKAALSANTATYSCVESGITSAVNYYRLKMNDRDGRYRYSHVVKLNNLSRGAGLEIYPNPVINQISIAFQSSVSADGTVQILNSKGERAWRKTVKINKGSNNIGLNDLDILPTGTYIIELRFGDTIERSRFIKL